MLKPVILFIASVCVSVQIGADAREISVSLVPPKAVAHAESYSGSSARQRQTVDAQAGSAIQMSVIGAESGHSSQTSPSKSSALNSCFAICADASHGSSGWSGPIRTGPGAQDAAQKDADAHNTANPGHDASTAC
jgi:hypothetical protein